MIAKLKEIADFVRRYGQSADHVVGMNRRNSELVYRYNQRKYYPLVDDKILCKEHMAAKAVPLSETLDICEGLFDVDRTVDALANESNFVLKPANGSGGKGIVVIGERLESESGVEWTTPGGRQYDRSELRDHLANIVFGGFGRKMSDRALVERRIWPHPEFRNFWSDGVCDLRVIVLEGTPLMAMLRVPTRRSNGKANLHQGGLGVAVDVATGVTRRASLKGESIDTHPETGFPLIGVQLPVWDRVLDVAQRAASSVPLGYLGVDLVIDHLERPLVLELNARPGLEIQNVNARSLDAALQGESV